MKPLLFLCALTLIILADHSSAQEGVNGTLTRSAPHPGQSNYYGRYVTDHCPIWHMPQQCHDCFSVLHCDGENYEPLGIEQCGGDQPYCDDSLGVCSANAPYECSTSPNIQCISEGYFPSPNSCQEYYICSKEYNGILYPKIYFCPPGYNYDAVTENCRKADSSQCTKPLCRGQQQVHVYAPNPQIYYYCNYHMLVHMLKCAAGQIFNENSMICEPKCTAEGILALGDNKFQACSLDMKLQKCEPGKRFDSNSNSCV